MAEQCNVAGCEQPVLVHFTGGPRDGQRWCWTHAPNDALVTRGVSRYEAFGRAAEPVLRAFATAPRFEPCPPDHHCLVDEARTALALLDGRETE